MSFRGDIAKFNKKALGNAEKVFRGTALSIFSRVIQRTPVDTGRLRGDWQSQINSAPRGTLATEDKSGGKALSEAAKVTTRADLGDSVYLVNNLPYAGVIENGSSDQAPSGMVKVTVAEFRRTVDREARRNK